MKKALFYIVLCLLYLVAFSGCGGNGSDSSTSSIVPHTPVPPDTWRTMAQNPLWDSTFHPRGFSLVWTGSEMILWGRLSGSTLMTGALYDPLADTWSAISTLNAPASGSAIWTGEEMIVFTGYETGMYNPSTDRWHFASGNQPPECSSYVALDWNRNDRLGYECSIHSRWEENTIQMTHGPPCPVLVPLVFSVGDHSVDRIAMIVWPGGRDCGALTILLQMFGPHYHTLMPLRQVSTTWRFGPAMK